MRGRAPKARGPEGNTPFCQKTCCLSPRARLLQAAMSTAPADAAGSGAARRGGAGARPSTTARSRRSGALICRSDEGRCSLARSERGGEDHAFLDPGDAAFADFRHGAGAGLDVVAERDAIRRAMGIVFQEPAIEQRLSGRDNLMLMGLLYGLSLPGARRRAVGNSGATRDCRCGGSSGQGAFWRAAPEARAGAGARDESTDPVP